MIHIIRIDPAHLSVLVHILEQLIPGEIMTLLDDVRQPPIVQFHFMALAAFAAEPETYAVTSDLDVLVTQRGQSVGMIGLGVFDVADADRGSLQQTHDRRQDLLAGQSWLCQVGLDAAADCG